MAKRRSSKEIALARKRVQEIQRTRPVEDAKMSTLGKVVLFIFGIATVAYCVYGVYLQISRL